LSQRVRRYSNGTVYGYNAQLNNANTNDFHGHGTHCAGIAAAHTGNGVGVAGVAGTAPVQIMPVKVLNDQGFGTMSDVARGITWAADNGAHVLSLSLGGNAGTQQLADAVNYAWNRGCVVVAAAGNNGSNAPFYPAFYENALAVAASDPDDRLTNFSQYGAWVDIAAPGSNILSTLPSNAYEAWSGTSMACPHVAGAAALIWSCAPNLTNQQLRLALENNADPVQPYWFGGIGDGKGRLNLHRALQAALQMENTPTVSQLTLSPTSVTAGGAARGTVVLSRPAGAGGAVVELRSSNPSLAWCAAQITIPQGQTTGAFDIGTAANGAGSATITASAGGASRMATLQVVSPFRVQSVSVSPAVVAGGQNVTLTVRLTAPAPTGGVQVSLNGATPHKRRCPPQCLCLRVSPARAYRLATSPRRPACARDADRRAQRLPNQRDADGQPACARVADAVAHERYLADGARRRAVFLNASAPPGGLWVRISNSNPNRVWTSQSGLCARRHARTVQFTVYTYSRARRRQRARSRSRQTAGRVRRR
jgi:hypothetical protein